MAATNRHPRPGLTLSQLPLEIQERIIRHVPRKYLFKLQKTSLHFFSLASAEIYADLNFLFTVTGTKAADTPAARLSEALDTFATSEFDYAQYVKSFELSISHEESYNAMTLTRLFWPSESDPTKILNMAILLMLKKARTMETFHWDVPVELTKRVYRTLHTIQSLRHLRIKSPGIPIKLAIQPAFSTPGYQPPGGSLPQGQTMLSAMPAPTSSLTTGKRLAKRSKSRSDEGATGAFAGFTKLASAAFIDLSNLNCISDIGECIKASSKSLRSLSLSLSYELASKSRKSATTAPPPNADDLDDGDFSDETEDMLNAGMVPPAPPSQPVSAADARKDKLAQDAILSIIFDMQGLVAEGKKIENDVIADAKKDSITMENEKYDFSVLTSLARLLTAALVGGSAKKGEVQRLTDLMSQVTKELDRAQDEKATASQAAPPQEKISPLTGSASVTPGAHSSLDPVGLTNGVSSAIPVFGQSAPLADLAEFQDAELQSMVPSGHADFPSAESVEIYKATKSQSDLDVDVDMDHPDESTVHLGPDQEEMDVDEPESSPRKRAKFEEPLRAAENSDHVGEAVPPPTEDLNSKADQEGSGESMGPNHPDQDNAMRKYIRATHGLQLEEFSLYLVPLKASIVARALDMTVLKRITLLDVGSQTSFWLLLYRLRKTVPDLGFHMIHTDDVSHAFLNFLTTFEGLREVFLHKKKKKEAEPDTTAPKADIKSICKLGLRKHLRTMTHLMLRNDADDSWDLDQSTVRILSLRGSGLVELVISMKLSTLHTLVQNITSFTSLRTLYFIHLRATSSGPASLYDMDPVSFLMDSLIHFPDRKIKYLGVSERFATVDSPAEIAKRVKSVMEKKAALDRKKAAKGKGKAKESAGDQGLVVNKGSGDLMFTAEEDSWDEGSADQMIMRAKECTLKWHTKFWEVEDCKVFEKGIRQGKLAFGA